MEERADDRARDGRRPLHHPAGEAHDRSEQPCPPRARLTDDPLASDEEDHHHRGDQDRERALIQAGEQQRAEGGPGGVRDDERHERPKESEDAPALQDEERVRHEDRDGDDDHRLPWPEHRGQDRRRDQRQPHRRRAFGQPGDPQAGHQRQELERTHSASPMSERQSTAFSRSLSM